MLDKRLSAIEAACTRVSLAADIGCDHGLLGIALLKNNKAERVLFTDISVPSLSKAIAAARLEGVSARAEFLAGDGLLALHEHMPQGIVIAGMGGPLINELLKNGIKKALAASYIVLCPHSYPERVREWLTENGFYISREHMLFEQKRYYTVITAHAGFSRQYEPAELMLGGKGTLMGEVSDYIKSKRTLLLKNAEAVRSGGGSPQEYERLLALARLAEQRLNDYERTGQ